LYQHLNNNQDKMYRDFRKKKHLRLHRNLQKSLFENPLSKNVEEVMAIAVSNSSKHHRNNADHTGEKAITSQHVDLIQNKDTNLTVLNEVSEVNAPQPQKLSSLKDRVVTPTPTTPSYFQPIWQIMATFVGWF